MSDLADFLLARIAEDQAAARATGTVHGTRWGHIIHDLDVQGATVVQWLKPKSDILVSSTDDPDAVLHAARWDPARVLAECEAKRAIVERHRPDSGMNLAQPTCRECGGNDWRLNAMGIQEAHPWVMPWPCPTLRLLALPYSEYQGYDESWRP